MAVERCGGVIVVRKTNQINVFKLVAAMGSSSYTFIGITLFSLLDYVLYAQWQQLPEALLTPISFLNYNQAED